MPSDQLIFRVACDGDRGAFDRVNQKCVGRIVRQQFEDFAAQLFVVATDARQVRFAFGWRTISDRAARPPTS